MYRIASAVSAVLALTLGGCAHYHPAWHGGGRAETANAGAPRPPRPPGAMFGRQVAVFDGHELWVDYACKDDSRLMVRYLGHWADAVTPDGVFHRLTRKADNPLVYQDSGYDLRGDGLSIRWATPAGKTHCDGGV